MKLKKVFTLLILTRILYSQEFHLGYDELIRLTIENNLTIKTYQERFTQVKLKEKEIFSWNFASNKIVGKIFKVKRD